MKRSRVPSPLDAAAARYTREARREYVRESLRRQELAEHNPHAPRHYRERILCGAYARTTGEPCRKAGTGAGFRCRLHGGVRPRIPGVVRDLLHDLFVRTGRRGAEIRWARVRAAGGLDEAQREFLSECAKARWQRTEHHAPRRTEGAPR